MILDSIEKTRAIFTLEEHVLTGGFGSKVLEFLERQNSHEVLIKRLALPDQFIEHGSRDELFEQFGLSPEKVAASVIDTLGSKNPVAWPQS